MLHVLGYQDFDLGIWFTTNQTIQRYNKKYRKKDKPTDILSFSYHTDLKPGQEIKVKEDEDKNLGDLIISLEFAQKDVKKLKKSIVEHLQILLVHGIAHLLGYDHKKKKKVEENEDVGPGIGYVTTTFPVIQEWTGEPTPDGDFRCYTSSIEDEDAAQQMVKDLKADGKNAWVEFNPETEKYVVKTGR